MAVAAGKWSQAKRYSEDQPRDNDGKFSGSGASKEKIQHPGMQAMKGKGPDMPHYTKYLKYVESGEPQGPKSYEVWAQEEGLDPYKK